MRKPDEHVKQYEKNLREQFTLLREEISHSMVKPYANHGALVHQLSQIIQQLGLIVEMNCVTEHLDDQQDGLGKAFLSLPLNTQQKPRGALSRGFFRRDPVKHLLEKYFNKVYRYFNTVEKMIQQKTMIFEDISGQLHGKLLCLDKIDTHDQPAVHNHTIGGHQYTTVPTYYDGQRIYLRKPRHENTERSRIALTSHFQKLAKLQAAIIMTEAKIDARKSALNDEERSNGTKEILHIEISQLEHECAGYHQQLSKLSQKTSDYAKHYQHHEEDHVAQEVDLLENLNSLSEKLNHYKACIEKQLGLDITTHKKAKLGLGSFTM